VAAATVDAYERGIREEAQLTGTERRRPLRAILRDAPILELDGLAG
jgi:hypothetical protein